ncbi:MAG: hypothetical protein JWM46_254 [Candidatus Kaiserbacteria bacterium]|nr:hypothetical protein [Candidatus Kaiserbacteria bacterium]
MLSLFPQILFLAPFSAFLIRLALFSLLGYASWQHLARPALLPRTFGTLEAIAAILLLAGAWTQAVALLVFVGVACGFFITWMRIYPKSTMLLALVMCASLVVTGAGAIAFDLPL